MTYLTRKEFHTVQAVLNVKARDLTPAELVLKTLKDGTYNPKEIQGEIDRYVENSYHASKIKEAIGNPEKLTTLLESYPLVEFYDAIVNKEYSEYVKMGLELSYGKLLEGLDFINNLASSVEELPLGVDTFIGTIHTTYSTMRAEYEETKDTKFLGLVTSKTTNNLLFPFFTVWTKSTWNNIIYWGLVNNKELLRRTRMTEHKREDGYQTVFHFENMVIGGIKTSAVVVTIKDQEKQMARYWFVLPE